MGRTRVSDLLRAVYAAQGRRYRPWLAPTVIGLIITTICASITIPLLMMDPSGPSQHDRNMTKVQDCLARGGDPEYTVNRYGAIVVYLGCG